MNAPPPPTAQSSPSKKMPPPPPVVGRPAAAPSCGGVGPPTSGYNNIYISATGVAPQRRGHDNAAAAPRYSLSTMARSSNAASASHHGTSVTTTSATTTTSQSSSSGLQGLSTMADEAIAKRRAELRRLQEKRGASAGVVGATGGRIARSGGAVGATKPSNSGGGAGMGAAIVGTAAGVGGRPSAAVYYGVGAAFSNNVNRTSTSFNNPTATPINSTNLKTDETTASDGRTRGEEVGATPSTATVARRLDASYGPYSQSGMVRSCFRSSSTCCLVYWDKLPS